MADAADGEALRRLIEKWRAHAKEEAARLADTPLNPTAMVATFELCADELEAALAPLSGPVEPDWKLLYENAEDMLLQVEWVRQAAGNKYACPFCKGIADRDGGPGHTEDCAWKALVVGRRLTMPWVRIMALEAELKEAQASDEVAGKHWREAVEVNNRLTREIQELEALVRFLQADVEGRAVEMERLREVEHKLGIAATALGEKWKEASARVDQLEAAMNPHDIPPRPEEKV